MNIQGVYIILNLIDFKVYVGSSNHYYRRYKKHNYELVKNCHSNRYLQAAWNKYGKNNFIFKLIEIVNVYSNLAFKEQLWMNYFQSYKEQNGYNLRPIAHNNTGMIFTQEHKDRIGLSHKGRKLSEEVKAKLKGRKATLETRIKQSLAKKGKKLSNETKIKMSLARKGKPHSKEHTEKVANANRGRKQSNKEIEVKRLALRQFDKWPCVDGWKCRCEACNLIRKSKSREYMRNWRERH